MKYQVIWDRVAEDELTALWLAASDRNAVTRASEWLERRLAVNPLDLGESRRSSVERIASVRPLALSSR